MRELPAGWVACALGDIADTQLGKMLSANARSGGRPRPYLRNKTVQWGRFDLTDLPEMHFSEEEFDRFRVLPGDLLVCEGGEVGRSAIWRGQVADVGFQKALHRIRPRGGIAPEFLLFWLRHLAATHGFDPYVTGSTIKHLPQEDLRRLPMPLPPLNEQRRVVAAIEEQFSRLDAADSSLQAVAPRLAVLGLPSLDDTDGAAPHVSLGELADGWRYGTSVKCNGGPGDVPVLRIPNIRDGRVDLTDMKFFAGGADALGDCVALPGDVLVIRTNGSRSLIGRAAALGSEGPLAFASYLIRFRPTERLDPRFAVLALSMPTLRRRIESAAASTAGQYNLNIKVLRALEIPLPPLDQQRLMVDEAGRRSSLVDALAQSIEAAQKRSTALRRAILDRAFRGELVPQDPSDEPASVLLERIRAERAHTGSDVRPRRRSTAARTHG